MTAFSEEVISIILSIPEGKVMTYGQIAACAGSPRSARQVARLLHSCSEKYGLPWHRVTGAGGRLSLPLGGGREEQMERLLDEGLEFDAKGHLDLNLYQWNP